MRKGSFFVFLLLIGCIELYFYQGVTVLLQPYAYNVKCFVALLYLSLVCAFMIVSLYSFQVKATTKVKRQMLPIFIIQYLSNRIKFLTLVI